MHFENPTSVCNAESYTSVCMVCLCSGRGFLQRMLKSKYDETTFKELVKSLMEEVQVCMWTACQAAGRQAR